MSSERHRRAQELFERAEALPPEEREAFLRTTCADDAALGEEVTALLEAATHMATDFLEPPRRQPPRRVVVGENVAHYRILRQLGAGGMGEVYLAEDERLKRRVALKVLPPELAGSPERLQRFQREAESVAALNHPNIVTIHSIENAEGLRFLTMELVDGPSLRELLDHSGALPIEEVLDLGVQIAEGLAEAHAAGIIHRDLKPGNVMVAPNGRAKLLDFGLARPERPLGSGPEERHEKEDLTREGAILGTVAYMSPEQLQGRRVDARSDVFSLGILLYELATGTHPFLAETQASTLAKILEREPEPLLEVRPGLPPSLERIVGRCLEKTPQQRYQDSEKLVGELKALRNAVASGTVAPPVPAEGERQGSRWRKSAIYAMAGVTMVLAALGAWRLVDRPDGLPNSAALPPLSEINSVAMLPLRNDSADPEESDYLARGIVHSVTGKLGQAGLRVAPVESVLRLLATEPHLSMSEIAERLAVETLLTGSFLLEGDRLQTTLSLVHAGTDQSLWDEQLDQTFEDIFDLQSQIALKVVESLERELTPVEREKIDERESDDLDAYDFYLQGAELLQAGDKDSTEVALQYFERAVSIDPRLADAHIGVGVVHSTRYFNFWGGLDDLQAAEQSYLEALRLDPGSMRARRGLMRVEGEQGKSEEVLILARDARRLGRPDSVESLLTEAQGYSYGGLAELSVPIFRRVLEIDPMNVEAAWWQVMSTAWSGDFGGAVEAGEDFLERFGEDDLVRGFLGASHYAEGRTTVAESHYLKALGSPSSFASLFAHINLGYLQKASGREEAAAATWTAALEALQAYESEPFSRPRVSWMRRTVETWLGDAPSPEEIREILAETYVIDTEIALLSAALASLGDWQTSNDLLSWRFGSGNLMQTWVSYYAAVGVDPSAPQLAAVVEEYDRKRSEFAERFASIDPDRGDFAR